jgi:hypothetical protein
LERGHYFEAFHVRLTDPPQPPSTIEMFPFAWVAEVNRPVAVIVALAPTGKGPVSNWPFVMGTGELLPTVTVAV